MFPRSLLQWKRHHRSVDNCDTENEDIKENYSLEYECLIKSKIEISKIPCGYVREISKE